MAEQLAAEQQESGQPSNLSPADVVRRHWTKRLSEYTGRAVIYYGTAWFETRPINPQTLSVALGDVRGFMEACSNITERDLDLVLHSPGGNPDAAEAIMRYLRQRFDHIRAVVPLAAMSAATMMALACDEVLMGEHSQLGPIDPQITVPTPEGPRTAPAQAIRDQFEMAQADCAANPGRVAAWMPLLRTLGPGLLSICETAQERTEDFVARELAEHMMSAQGTGAAKDAASWFASHENFKSHGRSVSADEARAQGVLVSGLEADPELQDLVLSVSHCAQITFGQTACAKLIENQHGRSWMSIEGQQLLVGQAPGGIPAGPSLPS